MTKVDELLSALENHELLRRGKQLRRLIEENPQYIEKFNAILDMQKEIVRLEYATGVLQIEEKKQYELELQELLDTPLISEYLLIIEELNDLVQTLSNILSEALNRIDTE